MAKMGGGRGLGKDGGSYGVGGLCVCAESGAKVTHQQGIPCTFVKYPACDYVMIREELLNR